MGTGGQNNGNIEASGTYLFAGDNIGTAASPLITAVGNIQAAATTGSIWLVNDGALTLGGVLASTPPSGVQAGGTVTITAMSPITVAQSINAVGEITLTSTHDADRGDMIVQGGALIDSSAGSVFLQAGDSSPRTPAAPSRLRSRFRLPAITKTRVGPDPR